MYVCPGCGSKFTSAEELYKHIADNDKCGSVVWHCIMECHGCINLMDKIIACISKAKELGL